MPDVKTVIEPLVNVTAPTVSEAPLNCNVPPLIVTAPASARTVVPLETKVPALIFVPPVYVFVPANTNTPVPALVRLPEPENTPE